MGCGRRYDRHRFCKRASPLSLESTTFHYKTKTGGLFSLYKTILMITLDHPVLECQYSIMSTSVGGAQGECRTRVFSLPDRLGQLTIIELVIYLRRTVFLDRVRSWPVLFRLLARRVSSYHCKTESTTTTRPYSAWTTLGTSWSWRRRSRTRVAKIRIAQ
jgi:hypothetical protein